MILIRYLYAVIVLVVVLLVLLIGLTFALTVLFSILISGLFLNFLIMLDGKERVPVDLEKKEKEI